MNGEIQLNGSWRECELVHPHKARPINVPGPVGMTSFQASPYARYDARVSGVLLLPGRYRFRRDGREFEIAIVKSEGDVAWGNAL
ncbi:hypothetical protein GCM10028813_43960 [Ramlibacter alkalitolerans]